MTDTNTHWIQKSENGVSLLLHIVPRASSTAITGIYGNALKIRIQAPPAEGKANKTLIAFLAGRLSCPSRSITIATGASGREKRVRIEGVTLESALTALTPPQLRKS